MRALLVYDSVYGNTEKIALAITEGLKTKGEVLLFKAGPAMTATLQDCDLLVVGAPTHGGWYPPSIREFLKSIAGNTVRNKKVATFDTRIIKGGAGKFARIFGYAADRIASELRKSGAVIVAAAGFGVGGKEGPLDAGELERARKWGNDLVK